jgi:hypothetical protein
MERMESAMQDHYDAMEARESATFAMGVQEGLRRAATMLREEAAAEDAEAARYSKIPIHDGLTFSARLLRSWANGLDMKADGHVEAQEGISALRGARK